MDAKENITVQEDKNIELVFFDTFSHDSLKEPSLDVVQFCNPVAIHEIRIIPLGAKVEADFPGGVRLGATNPSNFEVELFINDLKRPEICTFAPFGKFDYKQNVNIKFVPDQLVTTDCLLLKGKYITLTLAIFGQPLDLKTLQTCEDEKKTVAIVEETVQQPVSIVKIEVPDPEEPDETHDEISLTNSKVCNEVASVDKVLVESNLFVEKNNKDEDDKEIKSIDFDAHSSENSLLMDLNHKEEFSKSAAEMNSGTMSPIASSIGNESIKEKEDEDKDEQNERPNISSPLSDGPLSNVQSPDPVPNEEDEEQMVEEFENKKTNKNDHKDIIQDHLLLENVDDPDDEMDLEAISPEQLPFNDMAEDVSDGEDIAVENESTLSPSKADYSFPSSLTLVNQQHNHRSPESFSSHSLNESSQRKDALEAISSEEEYFDYDADEQMQEEQEKISLYDDEEINDLQYMQLFDPALFPALESLEVSTVETHSRGRKFTHLLHNLLTQEQKGTYDERWVEFVEQLSKDIAHFDIQDERANQILMQWTEIGLDFERAINQKQTAYKVRHLKAGLRLTMALVGESDEATKLLIDRQCLHLLINLFDKPHMSLPVKLLIVRALDTFADRPLALDAIFQSSTSSEPSIYQRLVNLLSQATQTRFIVSLAILLKKLHLYEMLSTINSALVDRPDEAKTMLTEFRSVFRNADLIISQRVRYLPASAMFEIPSPIGDAYACLYGWFEHVGTLETFCSILERADNLELAQEVLLFLENLIDQEQGINFLLRPSQVLVTERIRQIMLIQHQSTSHQQFDSSHSPSSNSFQHFCSALHKFSLRLVHLAYATQLIYQVQRIERDLHAVEVILEHQELATILNRLYSLTFTPIGCQALVQCLTSSRQLESILRLMTTCIEKQTPSARLNKSVCFNYAADLLLATISHSNERLPLILERYEQQLLTLCSYTRFASFALLNKWVLPLRKGFSFSYTERNVRVLTHILQDHYERAQQTTSSAVFYPQPDLISCVQLLHRLCIRSSAYDVSVQDDNSSDTILQAQQLLNTTELKHEYGLLETFSQNGFSCLLAIIKRLCECYLRPVQRYSLLLSTQGRLLISLLHPCVQILKQIIFHLAACRGNDFKDTSPVPTLLQVHSLMLHVPLTAAHHKRAQTIADNVIQILRAYTQLSHNSTALEDEVFNKSVWTKMTQEILNYTLSKPQFFAHGLQVLTQLLPLPLPLEVNEQDSKEACRMLNFRKLWSAHLHVISSSVEQLIGRLVFSCSLLVQTLLLKVCIQLTDLSSHTGLSVSKYFLVLLENNFAVKPTDSEKEKLFSATSSSKGLSAEPSSSDQFTRRLLTFFCCLLTHSPFLAATKTALNSLLNRKETTTDRSSDDWISRLLTYVQTLPNDQQQNYKSLVSLLENPNEPSIDSIVGDQLSTNATESLNALYNARQVLLIKKSKSVSNGITRTLATNLFHCPAVDLENCLTPLVMDSQPSIVNLSQLAASCISPDYDLRSRLRQLFKCNEPSREGDDLNQSNRSSQKRPYEPLITREYGSKRPYVAPMRGRGFQRNTSMGGRLNDPFRSRPPNTSRPPSMHVDDFVALEQHNNKRGMIKEPYPKYKMMPGNNNMSLNSSPGMAGSGGSGGFGNGNGMNNHPNIQRQSSNRPIFYSGNVYGRNNGMNLGNMSNGGGMMMMSSPNLGPGSSSSKIIYNRYNNPQVVNYGSGNMMNNNNNSGGSGVGGGYRNNNQMSSGGNGGGPMMMMMQRTSMQHWNNKNNSSTIGGSNALNQNVNRLEGRLGRNQFNRQ